MAFFTDPETVQDDVIRLVRAAERNRPRSKQTQMGPSGIGHDCDRHLALRLGAHHVGRSAPGYMDPLPAIVGVAMHEWMAVAVEQANLALGRQRWFSETPVTAWDDIEGGEGTCDLYDSDTRFVIDFKFPGPTVFKKAKSEGPSSTYRTQVHTYGAGHKKAGRPVDEVGILYIPRAGLLRNAYLWHEPFDQSLAELAHDRLLDLSNLRRVLDVEHHPQRYTLIPTTPGDYCRYCPFWSPEPQSAFDCSGK